jgi:3',5'-cyclic AMP phosphodiesterase CpdA
MHRIAHISDLHISNVGPQDRTGLEWLGQLLLRDKFKVDVVAERHNENKLKALKNSLQSLRPDSIVITGDITNYGDSESYKLAAGIISELQESAGAKQVVCIPGNHDCLAERVARLRARGWRSRVAIRVMSLFNQEAAIMREKSFDPVLSTKIASGDDTGLFGNYTEAIVKKGWGEPNPLAPVFIEVGWGKLGFFLFNSTNDPTYMANEGSIGPLQYNKLNSFLDDPAKTKDCAKAVRIALLHHHPISNPEIISTAVDRGYDDMTDGTTFMNYMRERRFHFILHGHQHVPFCWKNHPDFGVHILAAGSATAGDNLNRGSFGVLDLMTPFEARYQRFDYKPTGYEENFAKRENLAIRAIDRVRITPPGAPESSQDVALRNLFGLREDGWDEDHQYELLEYEVKVLPNELYQAAYRRRGKVASGDNADTGITFVITGSPPMRIQDINLSASDSQNRILNVRSVRDYPTQKVIKVNHYSPLPIGSTFDMTLRFQWQASAMEPNNFDGMNLMYFRHPVGRLTYRANLPWQPVGQRVIAFGLGESDPDTDSPPTTVPQPDGTHTFSFEITNPKPLAYLIWLKDV